MRLAISSGYRGPNSFTGPPSSFRTLSTRSAGGDGPPRGDRRLDTGVRDVDVRDHPDLARDHARADALLLEAVGNLEGRHAQGLRVGEDHVRFNRSGIKAA